MTSKLATVLATTGFAVVAAFAASMASDYDGAVGFGKPCKYEGESHAHGSEVCQEGQKMKCDDGDWEDLQQEC